MPPKKNKQQPKNAFYYFMLDMKPKFESQGRKFPGGLKDVADACAPLWNNLTAPQRAAYDQRAKVAKEEVRNILELKFDSHGIPLSHRVNYAQSIVEQKASMYATISSQITQLKELNILVDHNFYIGHFNYICVTDDKEYIPCEIAVVRFNLRNGIQKIYQEFIEPGPLPLGYSFTAMERSKSTHKIPVKNFGYANSNYVEILGRVNEFLSNDSASSQLEPIYFIREDLEGARKAFEWLYTQAGSDEGCKEECFELNKLFCELRFHSTGDGVNGFPSEEYAGEKLKQETFDYSLDMACEWHDYNDEPKHCSRAYAKRFCYLITDYCCGLYGIPMRPGRHCPKSFVEIEETDDVWDAEPVKPIIKPAPQNTWASDAPSAYPWKAVPSRGFPPEPSAVPPFNVRSNVAMACANADDFPSLGGADFATGRSRPLPLQAEAVAPVASARKPGFRAPHSKPLAPLTSTAPVPKPLVGIGRGSGVGGTGRGRI